jgi:hypothetical protein
MRWWPEDSPHYVDWRKDHGRKIEDDTLQRCEEACYADCEECKAELCVTKNPMTKRSWCVVPSARWISSTAPPIDSFDPGPVS